MAIEYRNRSKTTAPMEKIAHAHNGLIHIGSVIIQALYVKTHISHKKYIPI